jgi:hypothetical protein
MTRNPYSMKDIGTTMRDVKNKICMDLELAGLLEDDFSMELLVADKIIKLDLDINGVFEQVRWTAAPIISYKEWVGICAKLSIRCIILM